MALRRCPYCGARNEAHESVHAPAIPEPGDVGICWYCRNIAVFTEDGARKPTDEEWATIRDNASVRVALAEMRGRGDPYDAVQAAREKLKTTNEEGDT